MDLSNEFVEQEVVDVLPEQVTTFPTYTLTQEQVDTALFNLQSIDANLSYLLALIISIIAFKLIWKFFDSWIFGGL